MAQSPLLTVAVWQRKSAEVYFQNKDLLISAVNKGFNAMAAVLSKDSDPDEVQCALDLLSSERSIALRYDKSKDDSLRDLMYGVLESLHVSLKEWTEERNQVKVTGEISTPTEDDYPSLPHDYQISASELMRDEKMIKEEEMDNENTELVTPHSNPIFHDSLDLIDQDLNFTRSLPLNSVVHPADISHIIPPDNQMPPLNALRDEMEFKEENMPNDDVIVPGDSMEENMRLEDVENTGMGDAVNDSLIEPFEEDDSLRTIQPSDVMDYLINLDDEILGGPDLPLAERYSHNEASIEDVAEAVESEGENGLSVNNVIDNEGEEEEEAVDHPTDTPMDTSDPVKKEKRRRLSRQTSRPIQYTEPVEDSDEYVDPSVKKSKSDSMRMDHTTNDENKGRYPKGGEKSTPPNKKSRISKKNDMELECPECEFRTLSVHSWMEHLRVKHSTSPALAGLALLCECGHESLSDRHSRTCAHGNITVIRKRGGPIRRFDDEKETPQCVLCEFYPKTARGYVEHLYRHHESTLMQNGVYLKCSCGLEVRNIHHNKHLDECNRRQFTLHKLDDE